MSFDLELSATHSRPKVARTKLALHTNTYLRTRARQGSQWSALNEAFFTIGDAPEIAPGDVILTEIHYHPRDDTETEFIELTNVSSKSVNLRGAAFTKGIEFRFPTRRDTLLAPAQRLLLVKDGFAIDTHYGSGLPVVGQYVGGLDNSGEQLVLLANDGKTELINLTYNDRLPWPKEADGDGPTLVLIDPAKDPAKGDHWRPSKEPGGSPGR